MSTTEMSLVGSCYKCGKEFRRESGSRICDACRVPRTARKPLNPQLTFRETQVVNLVSTGRLNKEIAYELHLSESTIKEYLNRIFRKVGITNRTELAIWSLTHQKQSDQRVA